MKSALSQPPAVSASSVALRTHALSWQPRLATHPILSDIALAVPEGKVTAIVGPNGAGKTSLIKCLLGLYAKYQGSVMLKGQDLRALTRQERAKVLAYVSQQSEVMAELSVLEMVQMGLLPHHKWYEFAGESRQDKAMQVLQRVGMNHASQSKLSTLSGGELQRVLIARALVQQPHIMVLDEPTNHLDVYYQHQILHLLSTLGISVLLTVHDLNLAAQYCDHVLLMHKGKVVGQGSPAEVFTESALTQVFGLPCSVSVSHAQGKSVPNICFHPDFNAQSFNSEQSAIPHFSQKPSQHSVKNAAQQLKPDQGVNKGESS